MLNTYITLNTRTSFQNKKRSSISRGHIKALYEHQDFVVLSNSVCRLAYQAISLVLVGAVKLIPETTKDVWTL